MGRWLNINNLLLIKVVSKSALHREKSKFGHAFARVNEKVANKNDISNYPTCHGRPSGPCQPGSCVGRRCRCRVVVRVVDAYGTSGSTPDGEVVQRPGRPTGFPVLNQDRHRHASWGALGGLQRSKLSIFHVTKICENAPTHLVKRGFYLTAWRTL